MSKKRILLCVDVQNDFITGALRNEEAINKVPNIVNKINEGNWDYIFLTRDTHDEMYLDSKEGKKLPVLHCVEGTGGWEIESSVMEAVENLGVPYTIFDKKTFGLTSIADEINTILLDDGFDVFERKNELTVEICGFCTDICVVSNALILKANWYEWADIRVIEDCCAGVTPESHEAALTTMRMCQIDVI